MEEIKRMKIRDLLLDVKGWAHEQHLLKKKYVLDEDGNPSFEWITTSKANKLDWVEVAEKLSPTLLRHPEESIELGYLNKVVFADEVFYSVTGKAVIEFGNLVRLLPVNNESYGFDWDTRNAFTKGRLF